jgi:two-component system nitrogen regulation response regulator NtrX
MASDVLVVDDEADIRDPVVGILTDEGDVRTATTASALAAVRARKPRPDPRHLDAGRHGRLELLDLVKTLDADLPHHDLGPQQHRTAVSAIKRGAYEFPEKPFKSDRLILCVERAWGGEPEAREPPAARPGDRRRPLGC